MSKAWSWRHAFTRSNLPSTTKLVLHTLGMHVNEVGENCFPNIAKIAKESGLSKKSVITHLQIAEREGWIEKSKHGFGGQGWARNEYKAQFPDNEKAVKDVHQLNEEGGEPLSKGGEPKGNKVVKEVHTIFPVNIPKNIPKEKNTKKEKPIDVLKTVLSEETARDVIEHRAKLRKPLTCRAASGLIKQYLKCRDGPEAAADAQITAGWVAFQPAWYDNQRNNGRQNGNSKLTGDDIRSEVSTAVKNIKNSWGLGGDDGGDGQVEGRDFRNDDSVIDGRFSTVRNA